LLAIVVKIFGVIAGLGLTSYILGLLSWNTRFKTLAPFFLSALATVGLLSWALSTPESSVLKVTATFLGSWSISSIIEYLVHRYVLHYPGSRGKFEKLIYELHENHHDDTKDLSIQFVSLAVSVPLSVLIGSGIIHVSGVEIGASVVAGMTCLYGYYEWVHYASHNRKASTPWLKWQQKYHRVHHFQDANCNYGVTNPLWDLCFGTYAGIQRKSPRKIS
jgi:sterol desaturase/sphingolipid hydroxylase (fatty acid hydroxylase superfamily)